MAASRMAGTSLDHYHLIGAEPTYDAASNTYSLLAGGIRRSSERLSSRGVYAPLVEPTIVIPFIVPSASQKAIWAADQVYIDEDALVMDELVASVEEEAMPLDDVDEAAAH